MMHKTEVLFRSSIIILSLYLFSSFHSKYDEYKIYDKDAYMLYEICFKQNYDCCHYGSIYKNNSFIEYKGKTKVEILNSYKDGLYTIPIEMNDTIKKMIDNNVFDYEKKLDSLSHITKKIEINNREIEKHLNKKKIEFIGFEYILLKMKFKYISMSKKEIYLPNFNYNKKNKEILLTKEFLNLNYIISIENLTIVN